jgi:hypothetical protein
VVVVVVVVGLSMNSGVLASKTGSAASIDAKD